MTVNHDQTTNRGQAGIRIDSLVVGFKAIVDQAIEDWSEPERELVLFSLGLAGSKAETLTLRRDAYSARWRGCDMTGYRAQVVVFEQLAPTLAAMASADPDPDIEDSLPIGHRDHDLEPRLPAHSGEVERAAMRSAVLMQGPAMEIHALLWSYRPTADGSLAPTDDHRRDYEYGSMLASTYFMRERMENGWIACVDWSRPRGNVWKWKVRTQYRRSVGPGLRPLGGTDAEYLSKKISDPERPNDDVISRMIAHEPLGARCMSIWNHFLDGCTCAPPDDRKTPHDPDCRVEILRKDVIERSERLADSVASMERTLESRASERDAGGRLAGGPDH